MRVVKASTSLLLILATCFSLTQANDCSLSTGFKSEADIQAGYHSKLRGGKVTYDYAKIEVKYQPSQALDSPDCYDLDNAELLFKPVNSNDWQSVSNGPKRDSRYYHWNVGVKPCLEYQFKIQLTGNLVDTQTVQFELPQPVGPAPADKLAESGYAPERPRNFQPFPSVTTAQLTFEGSDCAEKYEVVYYPDEDSSNAITVHPTSPSLEINSLESCTTYKTTIYSILGEEYSDELVEKFVTLPMSNIAESIVHTIDPTLHSVSVSWQAWEKMSCIDQYEVKVCTVDGGDCKETQTITKSLSEISFTQDDLLSCTDYTMEIKPLHTGVELTGKLINFRTKSPDASTLSVENVQTAIVTTGTMKLSWDATHCATGYKVYQRINDDDWTSLGEFGSDKTSYPVSDITPCTKYHFAVTAVVADGAETERAVGQPMTSKMEDNGAYEVPNLKTKSGDTDVTLSWSHADCIKGYDVKACLLDEPENCIEEKASLPATDKTVSHTIAGLTPCTQYDLFIVPVVGNGEVFQVDPKLFTTTDGTPLAPTDLKVDKAGSSSTLSWTKAKCATAYKVFHQKNAEEQAARTIEKGNSALFEGLAPCEKHLFAVATLVGDKISDLTEWFNVEVAPFEAKPLMEILVENERGNTTLTLKKPSENANCAIEEYLIKYSSDGGNNWDEKRLEAAAVDPNNGILIPTNKKTQIKAKLRYGTYWSPEALHQPEFSVPAPSTMGLDPTALIPIVVGVAILLVVIIVIAVLIMRRKKSRSLDAEKSGTGLENGNNRKPAGTNGHHHNNGAVNDEEERQRLNANLEDQENFK